MKNPYWLWKVILLLWLLSIDQYHRGIDGRLYDKCFTRDGRQGVCVVKRYCREASTHSLIPCDDDDFCCPIPTTQRSAYPGPYDTTSPPLTEPHTRRPIDDGQSRNIRPPDRSASDDERPRRPISSYDGPVREPPPKVPKNRDKQYGRPRYDDGSEDRQSGPTRRGDVDRSRGSLPEDAYEERRPNYPSESRTQSGQPPRRVDGDRSRGSLPEDPYEEHRPNYPPESRREEYPSNRPREKSDDRRRGSASNPRDDDFDRGKRRNPQTDRPSHYPSRDKIEPHRDVEPPRRVQPPRTMPRNQSYEDSKAPIKFPDAHELAVSQPKVPECGVKPYELFIAGGEEADAHEWPWMTAIFRRHQSSRPKTFLCGGSLISSKYVLTAAHCFVNNYVILPASAFVVRLGSHYLNSGEEYTVSNLVIHHNHSGSDFFNDIALVRLASEVYITDKIAPICLPFPEMMNEYLVDKIATVAGWGDTAFRTGGSRALQHVSVPIVSSEECFAAYSRVRGAAFLARGSDHVICAGLREGGKDACLGDSGGPLMLKVTEDRWVIVGIVSLGYKCAEPGYPGVYTRVTHYMSWIQANMKRY